MSNNLFPEIASLGAGKFEGGTPPKGTAGACQLPKDKKPGKFLVPIGDDPVSLAIRCHEYGHLYLDASGKTNSAEQLAPMVAAGNNLITQSVLDVLVNEHLRRNGLAEELYSLPFPDYCHIREIDFTTYLRTLDIAAKERKPKVFSPEELKSLKDFRAEIVSLLDSKGPISTETLVDIVSRLKTQFGLPPEQASGEGDGESDEGQDGEESEDGEAIEGVGETSYYATSSSSSFGEPMGSPATPSEFKPPKTPPKKSKEPSKSESKTKKEPPKPKPIPKSILDELEGKKPVFKVPEPKKEDRKKSSEASEVFTPKGDPYEIGAFNGQDGQWGKMYIDYHKMDKQVINSEKRARKARPGFVGPLRYPLRALLPAFDGSAFGTKQRSKGGTLLIDLSGSMKISDQQIQDLVRKAPHLKLAMYCGGRYDKNDGDELSCFQKGTLAILAARGRRVEDIQSTRTGSANIVDGPALEWLSKQPTPRIWICDGGVTGPRDHQLPNHRTWALKLKKLGRIKQYHSIQDFQDNRPVPDNQL